MILSLQYLRGIAAMMVVAFHAAEQLGRLRGDGTAFPLGQTGVDIFFVISGFIIWTSTRRGDQNPLAFMRRRIVRLVPLYWALTLVAANIAILTPQMLDTTVYEPWHFVASLFFVPALHPVLGDPLPLIIPGWSLNYEMAFYLLFAACLVLPARLQLGTILTALAILVVCGRLFGLSGLAGFYTDPIILEFGIGVVIGAAYTGGVAIGRLTAYAALACGFAVLSLAPSSELPWLLAAGLPAALIVAACAFGRTARKPLPWLAPMLLLGNASYAIYLSHVAALPIVRMLWSSLALPATGAAAVAFVAVALIASAIGGILLHLVVERPLTALLQPRRRPSSPKVPLGAAAPL